MQGFIQHLNTKLLPFLLLACMLSLPGVSEARKVGLSGEFNQRFAGQTFKNFAISAVNTVPEFRFQFERRVHDLLNKHFGGKTRLIELSSYLSGGSRFENPQNTTDLLQELEQNNIEVLILFNVQSDSGSNLDRNLTLEQAIDAIQNHKHDPSKLRYYTYSFVTLYEVATGKIIWQGDGPLRASTHSRRWFKTSSKIQSVRLYKFMNKHGVLPPSVNADLHDNAGD